MSWRDLGVDGDPIRGNVAEIEAAVSLWVMVHDDAQGIKQQFDSIIRHQVTVGLEGLASTAFADLVADAGLVLDDVPLVADDVRAVLSAHLTRLKALQAEAASALARAKVAQAELRAAEQGKAAAAARVAKLQKEVDRLRQLPPEDAPQLRSTEIQLGNAKADQNAKTSARDAAQGRIDAELRRWHAVRASEESLNRETADRVARIDLRGLRDKSRLQKIWETVGGKFVDFFDDVVGFVDSLIKAGGALLDGRIQDALFHLRDAIDSLMTVLSVVAIALAVAVVTVATGGTALAALSVVVAVAAATKLVITTTLVGTQARHPETGERLDGTDMLFDAIDFALALPSAAVGVSALRTPRVTSARYFANLRTARHYGVVVNYRAPGHPVMWRQTVKNIGQSHAEDVVEGMVLDGIHGGIDGLNKQPRRPLIDADIRAIRSGYRGTLAPVTPVLVPCVSAD